MRSCLAATAALLATANSFLGVSAIPKITRTGKYLYDDSGNRFYIKGIAYQQQGQVIPSADNTFLEPSTFIDPLADANGCSRDVTSLQNLSVNAIRVYSVDSTLNHDSCMSTFSNAGIYTIIDLSLPNNGSLDRDLPDWSSNLLDQYLRTIDTFSKYDNVLAYNVGNEVVNGSVSSTQAAAFVKAAARDIKAYLASKNLNTLVGYAAIDSDNSIRSPVANFLSCDPTSSNSGAEAIDIYGLNNYEWCGDDSFQASGYAGTTNDFSDYNVVAYFSEFGCITRPPRLWTEVAELFSTDMTPVWSGGIAFSYFPAASAQGQFGMVNISSDNTTVITGNDYALLKGQYNNVTFVNQPSQGSVSASSFPSCPAENSSFIASTTLPPTPNESSCDCLESVLSCRFTPQTPNFTDITGELLGVACGLLANQNSDCSDISSNGTSGVYGRVSGCDPTIQLSFVMSKFYELSNRNPQSCDFSGNATINSAAPSSASAADAAASSCLSNPTATFVPTSPPTNAAATGSGSSGSSGSGGSGSSSGGKNGAMFVEPSSLTGIFSMIAVALVSAVWTLA